MSEKKEERNFILEPLDWWDTAVRNRTLQPFHEEFEPETGVPYFAVDMATGDVVCREVAVSTVKKPKYVVTPSVYVHKQSCIFVDGYWVSSEIKDTRKWSNPLCCAASIIYDPVL